MRANLPNILTLLRVAAVPFVIGSFYWSSLWAHVFVIVIFLLACITDFFDGYLARQWAQLSEFGRVLDPIADKLLISSVLFMLAGSQVLSGFSLIPAAAILCREILVSGLRESLARDRVFLHVTALAQWKTATQMGAISFLLVARALPEWTFVKWLGVSGLWVSAGLALVTGAQYLKRGVSFLSGAAEKT